MKTLLSRWTWVKVVEGALLMLVGLMTGILGGINPGELSQILGIVIAIFLFIDGGLTLFANIVDTKKTFSLDAIMGSLFIALSVVLCIPTGIESLKAILAIFVAVLLIAAGVNYLIKGIVSIASKIVPVGWIILYFISATILISLGVLCLIFRDQESLNVIFIVMGTAITIAGLFDIIVAIKTMKADKKKQEKEAKKSLKKVNKKQENDVIDAKDEDVKVIEAKDNEIKQIEEK